MFPSFLKEILKFIFPLYFINPFGAVSSFITYDSFSESIVWSVTIETVPSLFVDMLFFVTFPVTEKVAGLFVTAFPFSSTFTNMIEYFPDVVTSFLSLKFFKLTVFFKFNKFWFLEFTITFATVVTPE